MILQNLIWICPFILVLYSIPSCYYDLKNREVPENFWHPLYIVGLPVTVLCYLFHLYPIEALVVSLAAVIFWFIATVLSPMLPIDLIKGGDFWYLTAISLFFVQNPISGHQMMVFPFLIFLPISFLLWMIIRKAAELYRIERLKNYLWSENQSEFPMMLVISTALVFTVVLG